MGENCSLTAVSYKEEDERKRNAYQKYNRG
jgi:hypothetical protein